MVSMALEKHKSDNEENIKMIMKTLNVEASGNFSVDIAPQYHFEA